MVRPLAALAVAGTLLLAATTPIQVDPTHEIWVNSGTHHVRFFDPISGLLCRFKRTDDPVTRADLLRLGIIYPGIPNSETTYEVNLDGSWNGSFERMATGPVGDDCLRLGAQMEEVTGRTTSDYEAMMADGRVAVPYLR